jgi:cation diffusion facilitator CzcD-associated flavoprotein CzcO
MPAIGEPEFAPTKWADYTPHLRVAIVGAGFSGLGLAIQLKRHGINDFVVIERASDIGGTWRDNSYPGCACDVPSHLYSFAFAPNPDWSRAYSPQTEIQAYLRDCAVRFGIIPHIRFGEEVLDAEWNERAQRWVITTTRSQLTAQTLALGSGPLSEPAMPAIPGLNRFTGAIFHSARWDHDHDLAGEHVAVIGTGASAIQIVPRIQPIVERLTLFQRTPPWILPRRDHAIPERRRALYRSVPPTRWLQRASIYSRLEVGVLGFVYRPALLKRLESIALRHLRSRVRDSALRVKLMPSYAMGCKRILLSDDFYPALTRANVEVVSERIREVRATSVVAADGIERPLDTIILATGFHVADMPIAERVRGRIGLTLARAWRAEPRAYLGTTVTGFPNLFILIGPNTGLGHSSMVYMIESQLAYIVDALRVMDRRGLAAVEVRPEAQAEFVAEMRRRMRPTVWMTGCASWYLDAGGRNTALWPGFTWEYRWRTRRFDPAAYRLS